MRAARCAARIFALSFVRAFGARRVARWTRGAWRVARRGARIPHARAQRRRAAQRARAARGARARCVCAARRRSPRARHRCAARASRAGCRWHLCYLRWLPPSFTASLSSHRTPAVLPTAPSSLRTFYARIFYPLAQRRLSRVAAALCLSARAAAAIRAGYGSTLPTRAACCHGVASCVACGRVLA